MITTDTTQVPAPGVYEAVPFETYRAWPLPSNSALSQLARSPAHCKAYIDNPPEPTDALRFGAYLHSVLLETDADRYAVAPDVDRRTKAGKEAYADFVADLAAGTVVVRQQDREQAQKIADAVWQHPVAGPLLSGFSRREVSIVTPRYKARLDAYDAPRVLDIKTVRDASHRAFSAAIARYGYHRQAAMYLDAVGGEAFSFIAVEKTPPYAIGVYQLDAGAVQLGRYQYKALLDKYEACADADDWPDYGSDIIDVPTWAYEENNGNAAGEWLMSDDD